MPSEFAAQLLRAIERANLDAPPSAAVHDKLLARMRDYAVVGGMPAVVAAFAGTSSFLEARLEQTHIVRSYRDDLAKYARRPVVTLLSRLFDAVPRLVGGKFTYAKAFPDERAATVREAVDLLALGRFVHRVHATSANGPPLESEANDRWFKMVMSDVGLFGALLRGPADPQRAWTNEGPLAEQLVAQILRANVGFSADPRLHCWIREARGSEAEVDYLIEHGGEVVPIEVKAGSTGGLKSLHQFARAKQARLAVRVAPRPLALEPVSVSLPGAGRVSYRLLTVPPYLLGQLPRLLEECRGRRA